jgi:DNA repair exonuclease SbcCD nuclease subunit
MAQASYEAFERIVQLAIREKATFVLFAGDIHDCATPDLKAQLTFFNGVKRLDEEGIASCIIRGNLDHLGGVQTNLDWPASTRIFAAGASAPQRFCVDGEEVAAVYGTSFPRMSVPESTHGFCKPEARDRSLFRIGMIHANVGGQVGHDSYSPCSVDELGALDIDYWALGHVHYHRIVKEHSPTVVYPGSPQALSIRETGEHGCVVVRVDESRQCKVEFVATDSVRFASLSREIGDVPTLDKWTEQVEEELKRLTKDGRSYIVRLLWHGAGPLHGDLRKPNALADLTDELSRSLDGDPFVWIDKIENKTRPELDLETLRQGQDMTGDFLRLCRQMQNDAALRKELLEELALLGKEKPLDGLFPAMEEQLNDWLQAAEVTGADFLYNEDAS